MPSTSLKAPVDPGPVQGEKPTEHDQAFATTSAVRPSPFEPHAQGEIVAGKYELVRKLGEGGMGSVWVAKNLTLDVHVALKLLRPGSTENVAGAADRMLQEARAAARIAHPSIIQVFDFGLSELGNPFIAMELLTGESLAQLLKRKKKLKPARVAQIMLPIVDALAAAHERGIVHRDLKPDNVFLTRVLDGRAVPKVLDFGIAKLGAGPQAKLTQEGMVLGSPAYMAPEQARGEATLDGRTDLWALGVVMYEAVTGTCPFTGSSYQNLLWAVMVAEPDGIAAHGVNDSAFSAIVLRCLSKNAEARYPDMHALGADLASYLSARGIQEDVAKNPIAHFLVPRANPGSADGASMFPPSFSDAPEAGSSRSPAGPDSTPAVLGPSASTRVFEAIEIINAPPYPMPGVAGGKLSLRSLPGTPRHWIAAGLGVAAVVFTSAALWAPASKVETAVAIAAPVHRLARAPEALEPPVEPAPEPPRVEPVMIPEPPSSAEAATKKAPRPATRTARERRHTRGAELKDPFAEGR